MALTDNTRGALLMTLAMASFTVNDAFTKSVTPYINTGQILFVRGVLTCALVYVIARQMGALRPLKTMVRPIILMRCLCEVVASILYLKALSLMAFANVSAIMQSLPLAVTLGAALFLGEPVGWRRWTAILVGFLGPGGPARPLTDADPRRNDLPFSASRPRLCRSQGSAHDARGDCRDPR